MRGFQHDIAETTAGTTYSEPFDYSLMDNVNNIELTLDMSALVGGTLDVTPQYDYGDGEWYAQATVFTQQAAGAPLAETLDLTTTGMRTRFKIVAGVGVSSAVGKIKGAAK